MDMDIKGAAFEVFQGIKEVKPIIHNISNIVTVNDCANITLAAGGSPTMADDPREVEEITAFCNAFVINMGHVNDLYAEAMIISGKKNNEIGHPIVLDPVGAGAAKHRNDVLFKLLKEIKFSVIRGNISEIKFIATGIGGGKGVDALESDLITDDNIGGVIALAKSLSARTGAVIAISGETDIIADSTHGYAIKNGCEIMTKVTGTGCMLSSLIGVFCGGNPKNILEATVIGVSAYGYAGELAFEKMQRTDGGTSSFRTYLIDFMSKMDYDTYINGMKVYEV